jgi:hypothetical protein
MQIMLHSSGLAVAPRVQFHLVPLSIVTFVLEMNPTSHDELMTHYMSGIVYLLLPIKFSTLVKFCMTHHDSGIF